MWKTIFLSLLLTISQTYIWSQWNQTVELKNCTIDIKANQFTTTTFIEMEFYNANEREVEGLYQFELKPGQVITAFQLDLNGKYRDGSIEEKWKATNAYNSIVGKRVDPALLTMDYPDHYSLRIYPVPGRGSRKVTMTIQQLLVLDKSSLLYSLPLNVRNAAGHLKLNISVQNTENPPSALTGFIEGKLFRPASGDHQLACDTQNVMLNKPIAFRIPLSEHRVFCTKQEKDKVYFALRFKPFNDLEYDVHPQRLTIFWDASRSSAGRNIKKEIGFLKQFIAYHKIRELTIIPFNYQLLDTAVFYTENNFDSRWQEYLENIEFKGPTQLGCIDLTGMKADMFMLFSDGRNTYGRATIKTGTSLVYCIQSTSAGNTLNLENIVGSNGGKVIELNKLTLSEAILVNSKAVNWLMDIRSASGKMIMEQTFPLRLDDLLMINGTMKPGTDTLFFHYGNNNRVTNIEKIAVQSASVCSMSGIERIPMLSIFDNAIRSMYQWSQLIDFGLQEKIVTPNTAYIVLEKVDDYIKYNIAPPRDLEQACERLNYVKKDTRAERLKMDQAIGSNLLNNVVAIYNTRVQQWDKNEPLLKVNAIDMAIMETKSKPANTINPGDFTKGKELGMSDMFFENQSFEMGEVVVTTSLGIKRRPRELGFAMSTIQGDELRRTRSPFLGQALSGRVAGLTVYNTSASVNAEPRIVLRGNRSITGNNETLIVLDGVPVPNNVLNYLNTNDIESVGVLKGGQAATLYGSDGVNGALLITTKKGVTYSWNYSNEFHRLKDMADVDYIAEMKVTSKENKLALFKQLEMEYNSSPGFYLDMAQHFYESGLKDEAKDILMDAAESANGSKATLRAMGFLFESWKEFDEAIKIYAQLVEDLPANLTLQRDLALAYYQNREYQRSIQTYYSAIMNTNLGYADNSIKAMMLSEMNAIIAMYKDQLDISFIPASLIKPLPADLRVVLDCNGGFTNSVKIKEPGNVICNYNNQVTANGGILRISGYGYYNTPVEYEIKKAVEGNYKIRVGYYGYYSSRNSLPSFIRIMTFRNFGKENASIAIENVVMDNQSGEIEIGEVKW